MPTTERGSMVQQAFNEMATHICDIDHRKFVPLLLDCQTQFLLQSFEIFEEEHTAKNAGSVEREKC